MPTNVTKPIWRCDTCGTTFDADLAAATRCESAPAAVPLPPGELLLSYDDRSYERRGFHLERLYPLPLRRWHGTVAGRWDDKKVGHFPYYLVNVDPTPYLDDQDILRMPGREPDPRRIEGHWLTPHRPGHLNFMREGWLGSYHQPRGTESGWIAETLGLVDPDNAAEADLGEHWCRPLTEPVKAVLDALGAQIERAEGDRRRLSRGYRHYAGTMLGALAAEACRTRSGAVNKHWVRFWLHTQPAAELVAQVNDRWARWRAGEPGDVPMPRLRCRVRMSASKLTKPLKALIADAGVPWPERTDSDSYIRLLLRETLGYTMDTTEMLFDVPEVIAVTGTKGGVGKSTVAAAVARRLAGDGRRVVLVDCDMTGPSQHLLFDLGPVRTDPARGRVLPSPTGVPGLSAFSPGQVFGPDAKVHWTATTIADWLNFTGSVLALDDTDVVILDLPPGESVVHETVFNERRMQTTGSIHVTTGHPLALADTERGLTIIDNGRYGWYLRRRGRRHLLVENLSRASGTTAAGERVEIRLVGEDGPARKLAEKFQMGYAGSLPWAPDVADLAASQEIGVLAAMLLPVVTT